MRLFKNTRGAFIVGIDEVGRGCLAGDVYAGAVILPAGLNKKLLGAYRLSRGSASGNFPCRLADSKKLSPHQREAWVLWMRQHAIPYAVARVSPTVIDRINIARACDVAAERAYRRVRSKNGIVGPMRVIADGGLAVKTSLGREDFFEHFPKADEKAPAVSLASIIAKVLRDRAMTRWARRYSAYGFDAHKGYGTKRHYTALRMYGATPLHRQTFIRGVLASARRFV
jgi:ribonuclease HII